MKLGGDIGMVSIHRYSKVSVGSFLSHSYLAGVAAAKLEQHMPNMNSVYITV